MMTSLERLLSDVCFCSATARSKKADAISGVSNAGLNGPISWRLSALASKSAASAHGTATSISQL